MNYQQSLFATDTPIVAELGAVLPPELLSILSSAGLQAERQYIAIRRYSELARASAAGFSRICKDLSIDQAGTITKQGGFGF